MSASRAVSSRRQRFLSHIGWLILVWCALLQACGSSTSSVTSPTNVSRCALTMKGSDGQIPAAGGSGSIGVTAARDCTWTATVEGSWLSLRSTNSGQGDGTIEFNAAANPDPAVRRGAIVANGQRTELSQAPGACEFSLGQSAASFGQSGGSGTIQVRASSGLCSWTAESDADWIALRATTGTGTGTVAFEIAATTGPPRSGTVTVAGQKFSVTQSEGCTSEISPSSASLQPAGGAGTINITTPLSCPWTAASNVPWLTVAPASGTGPGFVTFSVAETSGPSRTGTAVVAGQTFTVTQGQGCSFTVSPLTVQTGASGGAVPITITGPSGCAWATQSDVTWISIQSGGAGAGSGTSTINVASTTGPTRTGTVTIAGQRVTVTQSPGCAYTISPDSATAPAAGGTGKVTVSTAAGCTWTAASSASWLSVTSGASGSGNGEVQYTAASTDGPARSATLTIGGRTFTLNQGQGCSFSLSSSSANISDDGADGNFNVRAGDGCGWTVASGVPWVTILSSSSGSGDGQVRFRVAANSGPARSGTITAAGQTFTVQQGNGCSYSLSANSTNVPAAGGTATVNVTAGGGCAWTATSGASWVHVTSGGSGTGNGTVQLSIDAQSGGARSTTVTIAGRTYTVNQASGCTFSINPPSQNVGSGAGSVAVAVTAPAGCGWNASSNAPWLSVTSGASGSGNGNVQVDVQANTGPGRSGTATIAGQTFTVTQDTGCSFVVAPDNIPQTSAGGTVRVDVTTVASCTWTAVSAAPWLSVPPGAGGTGTGAVDVTTAANTGPARSGTLTIAGRTVTVAQDSGCTFGLSAASQPATQAGGAGSVNVTSAPGCPWTAASNVPWITVTAGASGSGDGTVQFTIDVNATGAPRSGTLTIAGQTYTVNQD